MDMQNQTLMTWFDSDCFGFCVTDPTVDPTAVLWHLWRQLGECIEGCRHLARESPWRNRQVSRALKINAWLDNCSLFLGLPSDWNILSWSEYTIYRPITCLFLRWKSNTCPTHTRANLTTFIILIQCLLCVQVLAHRNSYDQLSVAIGSTKCRTSGHGIERNIGTQLTPASVDRRNRLPIWAANCMAWFQFQCAVHEVHLETNMKGMRYVSDSPMIRLCMWANPHKGLSPVSNPLNGPEFHQIWTSTIYPCIAKDTWKGPASAAISAATGPITRPRLESQG